MIGFTMRDPTAETAATQRDRVLPSVDLKKSTGVDIGNTSNTKVSAFLHRQLIF